MTAKAKRVTAWACPRCEGVYATEDAAARCCLCGDCKKPLDGPSSYCQKCLAIHEYDRACAARDAVKARLSLAKKRLTELKIDYKALDAKRSAP